MIPVAAYPSSAPVASVAERLDDGWAAAVQVGAGGGE